MKTAIAALAAMVCASAASADTIQISSNGYGQEGNGAFTGWITYTPGILTISLTNDNSSQAGGTITAFAFNIAGNAAAALVMTNHPAFTDLGTGIAASPYGTFERGASISSSWLGGGSPTPGIAIGATGQFQFAVSGPDAGLLTASSFIGSAPDVEFVVRFRGFDNGGSDKTPGFEVPAPAAAMLFAGAGLVATRRRRA